MNFRWRLRQIEILLVNLVYITSTREPFQKFMGPVTDDNIETILDINTSV